jgi:Uma2 family endonuclease
MKLALAQVGATQYALMEPVEGQTADHEYLAARGEGRRHLGYYLAEIARMAALGYPLLQSGGLRGRPRRRRRLPRLQIRVRLHHRGDRPAAADAGAGVSISSGSRDWRSPSRDHESGVRFFRCAARTARTRGWTRSMQGMATTKLWTAEELEQLPADEYRYALIKGELIRMPPPKFRHGRIVSVFNWHVYGFVTENGLGVVSDQSGFILGREPDTLLGPDLSFVQRARVPSDENAYPTLAPDLVVEVASPSQTGPSIEEKIALYLEAGVRLVWAVDPIRLAVHVRRADGSEQWLTEHDVIDGEDVLPGFRLPVSQLFDEAFR